MKGIVLAGGTGSRLWPITKVASKQLLPVYDKPMIYYPLSTLMLAGIQDILLITTPEDQSSFKILLGDGSLFGIKITYAVQPKPEGLAQAFIIGEEFLGGEACVMILGDNIFHGVGLGEQLRTVLGGNGCHIFTYEVSDPSQYGVLNFDALGKPSSIEEKPKSPKSRQAVTGLYYFDADVPLVAQQVQPSSRGELEITSVIDWYLQRKTLTVTQLSRGTSWLDTGNPISLQEASTYVQIIETRTGLKIACLEEIAFKNGWISERELESRIQEFKGNSYGQYLKSLK